MNPTPPCCPFGNRDIPRILLKSEEGDINAKDNAGLTPFHTAVMLGKVEVGTLLLKYGAAINTKDLSQRTPLIIAVTYNRDVAVGVLLKKGADPDCGSYSKKF